MGSRGVDAVEGQFRVLGHTLRLDQDERGREEDDVPAAGIARDHFAPYRANRAAVQQQ